MTTYLFYTCPYCGAEYPARRFDIPVNLCKICVSYLALLAEEERMGKHETGDPVI